MRGGGFIGIGEPSAYSSGGRFFQLADVLGVDKEQGFSLSTDKYFHDEVESHFITDGIEMPMDFGEGMKNVYALSKDTEIITYENGEILLSAHDYGKGRGVYMAGLPFDMVNNRVLYKAMFYAAHKEDEMNLLYAEDIYVEVHGYPEIKMYAVVNNKNEEVTTVVYDHKGRKNSVTLEPSQMIWLPMEDDHE